MFAHRTASAVIVGLVAATVSVPTAFAAEAPAPVVTVDVTPDSPIVAWQKVDVKWSYRVPADAKPGDTFSIVAPDQLRGFPQGSYDLKDPRGEVVAVMEIDGRDIRVTLSPYVSTHQDVTIDGWLSGQINSDLTPGQSKDLVFTVDGVAVKDTIAVGQCDNCTALPESPSKWAAFLSGGPNPFGNVGLPALPAGTVVTVTDRLTSPGQKMDCSTAAWGNSYSSRSVWGDPLGQTSGSVKTVSCDDTSRTVEYTVPDLGGPAASDIGFPAIATDASLKSYSDSATVNLPGRDGIDVSASAVRYEAGGAGGGALTLSCPTSKEEPVYGWKETPVFEKRNVPVYGQKVVPGRTILVQGDTYLPVYKKGSWVNGRLLKADAPAEKITLDYLARIARLDDDNRLDRREDRFAWGASNVTKVSITEAEAFAAGGWIQAYNRKTGQAAVANVLTARPGYPVTKAWALAPGSQFGNAREFAGGPQVDLDALPKPVPHTVTVQVGTKTETVKVGVKRDRIILGTRVVPGEPVFKTLPADDTESIDQAIKSGCSVLSTPAPRES